MVQSGSACVAITSPSLNCRVSDLVHKLVHRRLGFTRSDGRGADVGDISEAECLGGCFPSRLLAYFSIFRGGSGNVGVEVDVSFRPRVAFFGRL